MRRCVKCNTSFNNDDVLFCPEDGELVLIGAVLKETYCIEEMLGEGGMAMVFKATNILNNSVCAIKIIHPDMLTSEINAVERLLLEALKIKKINHPNIVKVLDFGPINDGELVYLTMELLTGKTLKKEIQENRQLDYKKTGSIIEQVCAGMEEAHQKGIIHRDIKSENIFLLDNIKSNISIKILDFGISSDEGSGFTDSKQVIGTPEYMSPEQCEGKHLDARSDVYSFGVTIYEMLTGQVPFPTSIFEPYEIIRRQMFKDPKPLSKFRPDILPSIEKIVLKALEKNRDRRQQSILELAKEFEFALREEGIIRDNTNVIRLNIKDITASCINQGLAHLNHGEYVFAANCFDEAIGYDFNNIEAYYNLGCAYQAMDKLEEAISSFNSAIEINPTYVQAYLKRGLCHKENKNVDMAISDFTKTINLDSSNAEALYNRGLTYKKNFQIDKAKEDFFSVLQINQNHAPSCYNLGLIAHYYHKEDEAIYNYTKAISFDPKHIDSYVLRGFAYKIKGDLDKAIIDCNLALQIDSHHANTYFVRSLVFQAKAALDLEIANTLKSIETTGSLSDDLIFTILGETMQVPY